MNPERYRQRFGCPELGSFSLREIESVHLPFGLGIERDLHFVSAHPISVWAEPPKVPAMRSIVGMAAEGDAARAAGSIVGAAHNLSNRLPTQPDPDGSGAVG